MPGDACVPTVVGVVRVGDLRILDVLLGTVVGVGVCVTMAVAGEPSSRALDWVAYVFGAGVGLVLWWHRRWPLVALIVSAGLVAAYHLLDYPAIGLAFPLAMVLFLASYAGHGVVAAVVSGTLLAAAVGWQIIIERSPSLLLVASDAAREGVLMAVMVLLGDSVRSRQALRQSTVTLLRTAQGERDQESHRRVAEEHVRIARELHDVTAHTVTVIGVQAAVAAELLDSDPDGARRAITAVRSAGKAALGELQTTLGLLRQHDHGVTPPTPVIGLGRMEELLAVMRRSGLKVESNITGPPRPVPAAVDTTAYRIAQESLTNVLRHSAGSWAELNIHYRPTDIRVMVRSCAAPVERPTATGHGIAGMTERVQAVGGRLTVGSGPDGFVVHACIPTPGVA